MNYDYQVITDHTSNYICMHIILDSDTLTHIDIDIHLKLITCTVICHYTGTWHVMYYVLVLCILYTMRYAMHSNSLPGTRGPAIEDGLGCKRFVGFSFCNVQRRESTLLHPRRAQQRGRSERSPWLGVSDAATPMQQDFVLLLAAWRPCRGRRHRRHTR